MMSLPAAVISSEPTPAPAMRIAGVQDLRLRESAMSATTAIPPPIPAPMPTLTSLEAPPESAGGDEGVAVAVAAGAVFDAAGALVEVDVASDEVDESLDEVDVFLADDVEVGLAEVETGSTRTLKTLLVSLQQSPAAVLQQYLLLAHF